MTFSIIIVSYNVKEFLEQAVLSLQEALRPFEYEIIIVDNASSDGTAAFVRKRFPGITFIDNKDNRGFARANNQALAVCRGEYICLINPDTIVQEDTFTILLDFFTSHPDAGMVTCKILNADGSLQPACRRSFPTPWIAFTKIIGLAALFPKSRLFGRYNLTYLDPGQVAAVEAISGSFMLTNRTVVDKVGGLDEDFFMYGEDLDWCYRIREAGYKIYYVPDTQIIHFKGESSKKSPFQQRRLFYEAMRLFVRKHMKKGQAIVPSWLLVMAIYLSATISFISTALRKSVWPLIDFILLSCSLLLAISIRFYPEFPWKPFLLVHVIYSLIWLSSLAAHGVYTRHHLSGSKTAAAVIIGWLINSAMTFFLKWWGFSRWVVLLAGAMNLIVLPGWRFSLKWLARKGFMGVAGSIRRFLVQRCSLIVGDKETTAKIIHRLHRQMENVYKVTGVVLLEEDESKDVLGVPVVGSLDALPEIIKREGAQEVIFSTDRLPYDKMLSAVANSMDSQISFKMVPSNLDVVIGKATIDYMDDIPFVDLDYRLHGGFYQSLKRVFDTILALILLTVCFPLYAWVRWVKKQPLVQQEIQLTEKRAMTISFFKSHKWWRVLPALSEILSGHISFIGRDMSQPLQQDSPNSIDFSLKPGLTGLEQVNRWHNLTQEDRNRYHLYYLKNYSPWLDIEILFKSFMKPKV